MAGRDHARVAEARAGGDFGIAFEQHDLVAVALQLIGGRDADHAAAEHHNAHVRQSTMARRNRQNMPSPQPSPAGGRDGQASLALNASNSASVAKDFCAPRRVTEKAA